MNSLHRDAIVVGVDGSSGSLSAVDFAVSQGRRIGAHVRVVHVVPTMSALTPAPMMVSPPTDLVETGHRILDRALARARGAASGLHVEPELRHGSRALELAAAAKDARMLVVGRDSRPVLDRMLLGDTAAGVASRAACPVVSVPPEWRADEVKGVVAVGIKSVDQAQVLLTDAFCVAEAHDARMVVVHAWRLPSGYDDIIESRVAQSDWSTRGARELDEVIAPYRARHPGVEVTIQVSHACAHDALERAARQADLVILARRAHGFPAATHLGGTARHVLRAAACPVRVIAPEQRPTTETSDRQHVAALH